MSLPNVPDIDPNITIRREDAINLLLTSIAMEEIGLSHIIEAEGEKIQRVVNDRSLSFCDVLKINDSVERILRNVIRNQMLLQFKLEDVLKLDAKLTGELLEELEVEEYEE
ncbi:hypothetical protein [Paenibacillus senegalensis]|uniref:hypothetical protein n=1 Tax=Paenibacillus senegalensis TaxID=1465766 RepID=UPI000289ED61|nr:hypothetical protein [Paenibacillus senegalensis]